MCRAKDCGGRRCQRGWTTNGKAKHNQMRRKNRAIRKNAAQWARDNGQPEFADQIEKMKPGEVKEFLREAGKRPNDFVDEAPAGVTMPDTAERVRAARIAQDGAGVGPQVNPGAARPAPAAGAPVAARGGGGGGGAGAAPPPAPQRKPAAPQGPAWSRSNWCTDDLRPRIEAVIDSQGGHRDERSLLAGQPEAVTPVADGTNETSRVELDNGVTGYHKPFEDLNHHLARGFGQNDAEQSLHEAAAWQLASRLGPPYSEMVPPVVIREVNGKLGSLALERPGKPMVVDVDHVPEWREAAFFDSLIGQQDRHPGNYLVSGDRLSLIDHGYTFARPGDYKNHSFLVSSRRKNSPGSLTYQERELLQKVVASPDLLGMRNVLSADRADAMKTRAERMLAKSRIVSSF